MKFKSEIKIEGLNPGFLKVICGSLKPEVDSEKYLGRGSVELECANDRLRIVVETRKLSDLHAIINSYLGLLKVSLDVIEVNL